MSPGVAMKIVEDIVKDLPAGIAFEPPVGARRAVVRDLSGQVIAASRLDGARTELALPRGVAILSIETDHGILSRRIQRM